MVDVYVASKSKNKKVNKNKTSPKKKKSAGFEFINPEEKAEKGEIKQELLATSGSPIAAFSYYPNDTKFIGADSQERIVLLLRRHPVTNLKWMLTAAAMLFAPFVISFLPDFNNIPEPYQLVGLMTWYMITMAFVIEKFLGWYFNVNVLTDERVFDVDFVNLIYREITDANIDQIQDVTVQVGGFVRTMFNYGNVLIQTASEVPQIEFVAVPRPDVVAKILRELRVQEEQEKIEGRVR